MALSRSERYLACALLDGTLRLWDRSTKRAVGVLHELAAPVTGLAFGPSEWCVVAVSPAGAPVLWETRTGHFSFLRDERVKGASVAAFNLRDGSLAIGGQDGEVSLWDVRTLACLAVLPAHRGRVSAIAFHPIVSQLATSGADGIVRVWDLRTGGLLRAFQEHRAEVVELSFGPGGRRLVSRDHEHKVKVWSSSQTESMATIAKHGAPLCTVDIGLAGDSITTGGDDDAIKVWDVRTGELLKQLHFEGRWDRTLLTRFRRDGTLVACGVADGQLVVFDPDMTWNSACESRHSMVRRTVSYREMEALGITETPAGDFVLVARDGDRLGLFDFESAVAVAKPRLPSSYLPRLALSLAGGWIALYSGAGHEPFETTPRVDLMRLVNGTLTQRTFVLPVSFFETTGMAINTEGNLLAVSGEDRGAAGLHLWNMEGSQPVLQGSLKTRGGRLENLVFSPDGLSLAASVLRAGLIVWSVTSLTSVRLLKSCKDEVTAMVFSPCGTKLAVALRDSSVRVLALSREGEATVRSLQGHSAIVNALSFSPDGSLLASASHDRTIRLWEPVAGAYVDSVAGHDAAVLQLAFCRAGSSLVSIDADLRAVCSRVCKTPLVADRRGVPSDPDCVDKRVLAGSRTGGPFSCLAWSPEGGRLAITRGTGAVSVLDVALDVPVWKFDGHDGEVKGVSFSPGGAYLATVGADATLRVRPVFGRVGARTLACKGHSAGLSSVAFDPTGEWIATAGRDGSINVWDAAQGRLRHTLTGHQGWVQAVAYSPDGSRLVSASKDGTAKVWETSTGEVMWTLRGHEAGVDSVAISPDGRWLATAGSDELVLLWEARSGHLVRQMRGHVGGVDTVSFSPDGYRLASAGQDGLVRIWDAVSGELRRTMSGFDGSWLHCLAFSPDGRWLAAAGEAPCVSLWDVAP